MHPMYIWSWAWGTRCPEMCPSPAGIFSGWEEPHQGPGWGMHHMQQGRGSSKKTSLSLGWGQDTSKKEPGKFYLLETWVGDSRRLRCHSRGGASIGKGVGWCLPLGEWSPGTCPPVCVSMCVCACARVCVKVYHN